MDSDLQEDQGLWGAWADGNASAGHQLSRRLLPLLRSFFTSKTSANEVDDLVQQVWLALGETMKRHSGLELNTSVRAYILGIARHVLFRHIRRRSRDENVDPIDSSIAVLEPSLSQAVGRQLQAQRMLRALQRLPLEIQTLLELRYVQCLTNAEIAAMYAVPEGTVKSRLSRARRMLEEKLDRKDT